MKNLYFKKTGLACVVLLSVVSINAQTKCFLFPKQATVDLSANVPDYQPALLIREMPKQGSSKMIKYNYPATSHKPSEAKTTTLPGLIKGQNFIGNQFSISTPCDNDMAISDSGIIASVMNTNIFFRNTATGGSYPGKSLAVFTTPVNSRHQEFDPKVIYDPEWDRFVLMCLVGNVDSTSKVILGFSQTSNPSGAWNLYTLPGDPLNNNLWTDYPMLSLSKKDLYLTVNLLYNDSTWQAGFVETLVWQIKKSNGFLGQPLVSDLHSGIKFNNKAIRNLCPVKGGSQLYGPNMYFVSNRNLASQNDTVFLVNITDTTGAPGNTVTVKALVSNQPYYFPPDALQPIATQSLATNDSRNLGAFFENNKIQYVHNTNNPANNRSTVYHGIIDNPASANPTVTGYLLPNDTMYFGYPNISYSGNSATDNMSTISFDHTSTKVKPGISAVQSDGAGNYSEILRIKNGLESVNLLQGNLERWGDYSGSQRRYNKPGEVWMSGYFGYAYSGSFPLSHATWIAQLTNSVVPFDESSLNEYSQTSAASVFPNPSSNIFSLQFHINKPEYLNIELFDVNGKSVALLLRDWVKTNENLFSFNTRDLSAGIYLLKITGNNNTNITSKVVIQ